MARQTQIPTLFCVLLLSVACTSKNSSNSNPASTAKRPTAVFDPSAAVLVGAGDIASCDDLAGAQATAKLIDNIPGTVFAAGDLAYPDGSDEQFAKCYGPTWGRFKDRTRPAAGNHEYHSDGASGYVRYFAAAAGEAKRGYYKGGTGYPSGWQQLRQPPRSIAPTCGTLQRIGLHRAFLLFLAALIFAHRFRWAAAIRSLPAAEIFRPLRVGVYEPV